MSTLTTSHRSDRGSDIAMGPETRDPQEDLRRDHTHRHGTSVHEHGLKKSTKNAAKTNVRSM